MSELGSHAQIGPGTAVLVVGASGVGKDTLLDGAARLLRGEPDFVFVRRAITRAPHRSEDFTPVTRADFEAARQQGAYALSWEAHGLGYGIPIATDADIAAGRTIVLNASRAVVPSARRRYACTRVLMVTCPPAMRVARIAARGRESASEIEARLSRSVDTFDPAEADAIVDNAGSAEHGIAQLVGLLRFYATLSSA